MSFFDSIIRSRELHKHDGRVLWKYNLTDIEFHQLISHLKVTNLYKNDPKDFALFYSEWWKRIYSGGNPSKYEIFGSIGRRVLEGDEYELFFDKAKLGAQLLGIKWIKRLRREYLRTLLLQGGIPLKHISQNSGPYSIFLTQLLELRPKTIEDIESHDSLIRILPKTSRNEIIYENCLSIVNAIINEDEDYLKIFDEEKELKKIKSRLIEKGKLTREKNVIRPKLYWVLRVNERFGFIYLKIGLSDVFKPHELQYLLQIDDKPKNNSYEIYYDDNCICTFRKTISETYKTVWESNSLIAWNLERVLPQFFCISGDKRWELTELITTQPSIDVPTLWVSIGQNEWRLVRGNKVSSDEAIIIYNDVWKSVDCDAQNFIIGEMHFYYENIVNTKSLTNQFNETVIFSCDTVQFDWTVISEKPGWMHNSNLPVIKNYLRIHVYDQNGQRIDGNKLHIYYNSKYNTPWQLYNRNNILPLGILYVKIEFEGQIAYDEVYNIGEIDIIYIEKSLNSAVIEWNNIGPFSIELNYKGEHSIHENRIKLNANPGVSGIPRYIDFKLKKENQKGLYFNIYSPFNGIGLLDKKGKLIQNNSTIPLFDLYGLKILTTNKSRTLLRMSNILYNRTYNQNVKILKKLSIDYQPLITFKESLERLFYLGDTMANENILNLEIIEGLNRFYFNISGHTCVAEQVLNGDLSFIKLDNDDGILLFGVQLNVPSNRIKVFNLEYNAETKTYFFPMRMENGQFIVFSDINDGKRMQPIFINTDINYKPIEKYKRIAGYVNSLLYTSIDSEDWNSLIEYFNLCKKYRLPFSTFDQIMAIGLDSKLAAKAFFYLGLQSDDTSEYIQKDITELEQDLGFCFHWIPKEDWRNVWKEIDQWRRNNGLISDYIPKLLEYYFKEIGFESIYRNIANESPIEKFLLENQFIIQERGRLGERVLQELPTICPHVTDNYNIPIDRHKPVKLLLCAPIAVAESIANIAQKTIWANGDNVNSIKRNIQYSQYLAPELYKIVLYKTLNLIKF